MWVGCSVTHRLFPVIKCSDKDDKVRNMPMISYVQRIEVELKGVLSKRWKGVIQSVRWNIICVRIHHCQAQ